MSFKDKLKQVTRSREEALIEQREKEQERANKLVENQTEAIYNRIEATLMQLAKNGEFKTKIFSNKKYIEAEICIYSSGPYDQLLKSETRIVGLLSPHHEMYCCMTKEGMRVIENVRNRASQNDIECKFDIKMQNLDKRNKKSRTYECTEGVQIMSYEYGNPSCFLRIHAAISY